MTGPGARSSRAVAGGAGRRRVDVGELVRDMEILYQEDPSAYRRIRAMIRAVRDGMPCPPPTVAKHKR